MLMPTAVAIQWVVATTPKVPSISGRVVKRLGLMKPMEGPDGAGAMGARLAAPHRGSTPIAPAEFTTVFSPIDLTPPRVGLFAPFEFQSIFSKSQGGPAGR